MTTSSIDPFPLLAELPLPSFDALGLDGDSGALAERQRLEEMRRQARAEGHRMGYADGRAEGLAAAMTEARSELGARITALDGAVTSAVDSIEASLRAHGESSANRTVELAMAIAEMVVGRALDDGTASALDALASAISVAPDRGDIVMHVNPADVELVDGRNCDGTAGRSVTVVGDPAVPPGGCVLDVAGARIDASPQHALERVRAVLLGAPEAPAEALP